jgi:GntR family transcriptional regulator
VIQTNMQTRLPKYMQIQTSISNWIAQGDINPGDQIPSERELSQQFKVSRMTVRQAISNLVNLGVLQRNHGVGTFVSRLKIEHDIGQLVSFTESTLRRGLNPSGKLLEFAHLLADEKLARALHVNIGEKLSCLVRVRFANNEPLVLERCYFPCSRFPQIEKYDLENQSMYHIWREEYGVTFGKMRQTLEPVAATEYEAHILGVPVGFYLMLVERITFDSDDQPVEYARDVHRGDKSRFIAEINVHFES